MQADVFYKGIIHMLKTVLADGGESKYEELWNGDHKTMPFPTTKLQKLIQLVDEQ